MRPDFKQFRGVGLLSLLHSAKGSTWEEHKYIKRIDGTYYYPDSYEGGRHLPSGSDGKKKETKKIDTSKLTDADKELIKKLREELVVKSDEDWDLDKWDGTLTEADIKLLEQLKGDLVVKSDEENEGSDDEEEWGGTLSEQDIDNLAREVIRGNFGAGQERMDLLGEHYQVVQNRVNELMSGSTGSTNVANVSNEQVKEGEKAVKSALEKALDIGISAEFLKKKNK